MKQRSVLTKWRDLNKSLRAAGEESLRVEGILNRDWAAAGREEERRAKGLPDGPAMEREGHIQTRKLTDEKTGKEIIGKRGFSNESAWDRFLRLGQHVCKELCTDKKAADVEIERALDRRDAGNAFAEAWGDRQPGSRDSTDLSPRGGATADGLTTAMVAAGKILRGWEAHMGGNDWMLVRRVCGEDYTVSAAVLEISPAYRDVTLARFREALDALVAAAAAAGKCQWCRAGRPHGSALDHVSRETS